MGQIQLTVSLILIALFSIAIIGFAVNFAADNNAPVNIVNDPEITTMRSRIESNLSSFKSKAEGTYQSIVETTIEEGQVAPSVGPFTVTPLNVLGIVRNILKSGYVKIFGSESGFGVFLTTFLAVLLFMIGLYAYKTLRGFPD